MKCKHCKRTIEDNSIFCNWCGTRLIKEKVDLPIPKPVKTANGYHCQVMVDGKRYYIHAKTAAECKKLALGYKTGTTPLPGTKQVITLRDVVENYINSNYNVQAPDSIRTYESHLRCAFVDYMEMPYDSISWQQMVNEEALKCSPKTLKNRWGTVQAALHDFGITVPIINLPSTPKKVKTVLSKEQLTKLAEVVRDDPCELGILLCLHGLRVSEVCALTVDDIHGDYIYVNKAYVPSPLGGYVLKETTKTEKSTRRVPILYPRVLEILPEKGKLVTMNQATLRRHLDKLCKENDLPHVVLHGLRRTFATQAHKSGLKDEEVMQLGGWSTPHVMHQEYITMTDQDSDESAKKLRRYYGNYYKNGKK